VNRTVVVAVFAVILWAYFVQKVVAEALDAPPTAVWVAWIGLVALTVTVERRARRLREPQ